MEPETPPSLPPDVVLRMPLDKANRLQEGLADLLCWCRGYMAAADPDTHPMGVDRVRILHIDLKDALNRAEEWRNR